MGKVIVLYEQVRRNHSPKGLRVLAQRIRAFAEHELIEAAAVELLDRQSYLELATDHEALREALEETAVGQAVTNLAGQVLRVAWTLSHSK